MELDFGRLGFGFLRLPQREDGEVDFETTAEMVDLFLARGFRYFDTAYTYLNGKSEVYLRKALVERYPRESFLIADKLPCGLLRRGLTAWEIFREQQRRCGVDYFDVYLLHGLDGEDAEFAEKMGCFDFLRELKEKGLARKIGFSFHDTADVLDGILTAHPEIDVVQIQLNYLDWDNPIIQSGACHAVCRKHGKPIIVMEPVKGGTLASVPAEAARLMHGEAPAHMALRFAASREGVALVLSGMSTMEQLAENTALLSRPASVNGEEEAALQNAARIIREAVAIPCTGCAYCVADCPAGIPIPKYFTLFNDRARDGWQANAEARYQRLRETFPAANTCLSCGLCARHCPQKLQIPELMGKVSEAFDR